MQAAIDPMQTIGMLDDYERLCREEKSVGAFEAFRRYSNRYRSVFDGMLKYAFMAEAAKLKPLVLKTDFCQRLSTAKENLSNGYDETIRSVAKRTANQLGFAQRFTVYLGMGVGNVGGYAGPAGNAAPFIYIGMDLPMDEEYIRMLVPHEINHMVRCAALPDLAMFDVLERTVSEGLASMCPILLNRIAYNPLSCAQALGVPLRTAATLMRRPDDHVARLSQDFGQELTAERMAEYFSWAGGRPHLTGYFAGLVIVKELTDRGHSIRKLTVTPSAEIWSAYSRLRL